MALTLATRTHGRPTTDHSTTPPTDRGRDWLTRILAGDPAVPPVAAVAPPLPAGRTPAEYDAVARALGCPDLFVVAAPDRPARERVLADLARSAAGCGERVLILSPDAAAADRLTEATLDGGWKVVRALADDENPHRPIPAATRHTSVAAGSGRVDAVRRDAANAVAGADADLAAATAAAATAEELRGLADRFAAVEPGRAALAARRGALDAEVRAEADGTPTSPAFADRLAGHAAERDAALAPLTAARADAAARHADRVAALAAARQHAADARAEAERKPGFFSRLIHKPKHPADPADLDKSIHDLEAEAHELAARVAAAGAESDAAAGRFAAEREKLIGEEVAARRAEIDARSAALAAERDAAAARFAVQIRELERAGLPAPPQLSVGAVGRVLADAAARRADAEGRAAAARERLAEVTRSAPDLVRRFLAEARVVVGTPGSLTADQVFEAARDADAPPFALLVLDHAEELTEPDFENLSRLAARWVLAGEVAPPDDARPPRAGRPLPPTFVTRVARALDREPWAVEGDRLVARLAHIPPDRRRHLTREPLVDRPEIELRVAPGDDGGAVLTEVGFPAATPVAEAKAFLLAQLGEVLLRPCGGRHWHRDAGTLTACWPAAEAGGAGEWIDLGGGAREKVSGGFTAAVAFDESAGWDDATAEAWLAARLPAPTGRVAVLPRPAAHPAPHRPVAVGT